MLLAGSGPAVRQAHGSLPDLSRAAMRSRTVNAGHAGGSLFRPRPARVRQLHAGAAQRFRFPAWRFAFSAAAVHKSRFPGIRRPALGWAAVTILAPSAAAGKLCVYRAPQAARPPDRPPTALPVIRALVAWCILRSRTAYLGISERRTAPSWPMSKGVVLTQFVVPTPGAAGTRRRSQVERRPRPSARCSALRSGGAWSRIKGRCRSPGPPPSSTTSWQTGGDGCCWSLKATWPAHLFKVHRGLRSDVYAGGLIGLIAPTDLQQGALRQFGPLPPRIVVSRPVRFAGSRDDDKTLPADL